MKCSAVDIDYSIILLKDTIKKLKIMKKESNFYNWQPIIECNLINVKNNLNLNLEN